MEVGINLYSKWPYEKVVAALVENRIHHTFVMADHPQLTCVMALLAEQGIIVDNFHAPFKGQNAIWTEGEDGEAVLARYMHTVDLCVHYGVPLAVGHVSNGRPMPPITQVGIERFDALMSYAEHKGISLAFESHRYVENVRFVLERYPKLGFCLDTAHEDAFTPGVRYMPMWGDRLVATHISDNDCACDVDMHMLPFDGHIDFAKTAAELARYNYNGTLMLEVKPDNHALYKDVPISAYYREAAARVRKLAAMVECEKQMKDEADGEKK